MSIVSGLATAPGVSALLNAPRETNASLRALAVDTASKAAVKRADGAVKTVERTESARPVAASSKSQTSTPSYNRPSNDARYTKFVDAVTALRIDLSEVKLTKQRIAELRQAAKEVFNMDDGVPREVRPDIPNPGALAAEARAEAAERAEATRQAAAKSAEADQLEAAIEKSAAIAETVRTSDPLPDPIFNAPRPSVEARAEPLAIPENDAPPEVGEAAVFEKAEAPAVGIGQAETAKSAKSDAPAESAPKLEGFEFSDSEERAADPNAPTAQPVESEDKSERPKGLDFDTSEDRAADPNAQKAPVFTESQKPAEGKKPVAGTEEPAVDTSFKSPRGGGGTDGGPSSAGDSGDGA
ncbi:MAG: hypothetical protein AAGH68_06885 [Pseudomonadota bacterium]